MPFGTLRIAKTLGVTQPFQTELHYINKEYYENEIHTNHFLRNRNS